jgi:hypothetical protein
MTSAIHKLQQLIRREREKKKEKKEKDLEVTLKLR